MNSQLRFEHVIYQNPFLAIRIWQIDSEEKLDDMAVPQLPPDENAKHLYKWHYHPEIEFLLVREGALAVYYRDENVILHKGELVVLGSSEPHLTIQAERNLQQIVLQIQLKQYWDASTMNAMHHFTEVLRPLSSLNYIFQENSQLRAEGERIILTIFQEMNEQQSGYELAVSSLIKQLLLLLLRNDYQKQLNYGENQWIHRLQPAIAYAEQHLGDKVSAAEAAAAVNMSYTYFIKTFKQTIGMSFTDFISFKRIKKAEQMLLTSSKSISEIAEAAGMTNIGHFYNRFRKYNSCSPKQFRERYLVQESVSSNNY